MKIIYTSIVTQLKGVNAVYILFKKLCSMYKPVSEIQSYVEPQCEYCKYFSSKNCHIHTYF